jgi:hypothetical protein
VAWTVAASSKWVMVSQATIAVGRFLGSFTQHCSASAQTASGK